MSAEPHGNLTAVTTGQPHVQVTVDGPLDTKGIKATLFEVDAGDAADPHDDLITYTIDLDAKGDVTLKDVKLAPEGKKERRGGVEVAVKGFPEVHRVPVLHDVGENEGAEVELGLRVEATGKTTYLSTAVGKTAPLVQTPTGEVVTFLMAKAGGYFSFARDFWSERTDALVEPKGADAELSLEEVWAVLDESTDAAGNPLAPFHEVNVVTHGAVGGIQLALTKGRVTPSGEDPLGTDSELGIIETELAHTDALRDKALAALPARKMRTGSDLLRFLDAVAVPDLHRVDPKTTRIVIRGCNVGVDPLIMKCLRRLFRGAEVIAARFLTGYSAAPKGKDFVDSAERLHQTMLVYRAGRDAAVKQKLGKLDFEEAAARVLASQDTVKPVWPTEPALTQRASSDAALQPYQRILRETFSDAKLQTYSTKIETQEYNLGVIVVKAADASENPAKQKAFKDKQAAAKKLRERAEREMVAWWKAVLAWDGTGDPPNPPGWDAFRSDSRRKGKRAAVQADGSEGTISYDLDKPKKPARDFLSGDANDAKRRLYREMHYRAQVVFDRNFDDAELSSVRSDFDPAVNLPEGVTVDGAPKAFHPLEGDYARFEIKLIRARIRCMRLFARDPNKPPAVTPSFAAYKAQTAIPDLNDLEQYERATNAEQATTILDPLLPPLPKP